MHIHDVGSYGARGDGVHDDAPAVQAAIDACAAAGGGTVLLPPGRIFRCGPIRLRARIELHVAMGSTLRMHGRAAFPDPEHPVFIAADAADGMAITGHGTIDGDADVFTWRGDRHHQQAEWLTRGPCGRPVLICLAGSRHITVRDVTLANAPFWTLHLSGCEDVLVSGIRVLNRLDRANCDGIDIDGCRHVRITGCHVEAADDAICLKTTARSAGPTEHVVITGCTLVSTSSAIKFGSESHRAFRDVVVSGCAIAGSNRGVNLQLRDQGSIEDVLFSDLGIETRRFSDAWWGSGEPICITALERSPGAGVGAIRNVRFRGISCRSENGILVAGLPDRIADIAFADLRLDLRRWTRWAHGFHDLRPCPGDGRLPAAAQPFRLAHAHRVRLRDVSALVDGRELRDAADLVSHEDAVGLEVS